MDISSLKEKLIPVAQKHGLDMLVLFGSQATGKTHPKSDIDFGFTASQNFDLPGMIDIQGLFSSVLKRKDVELVDLKKISPTMKKIISDEGVLLYERVPGTFILFKLYAFKLYVETKFLRDLRYQSLSNFINGDLQRA